MVNFSNTWSNAWLASGTTLQEVVNQPFLSHQLLRTVSQMGGPQRIIKMFSLPSLQ